MTWVIGRSGPFGHAIGISDIRITLQDGSEHDCLQKIYKVAPQLVLGFAGAVAIGLEVVAQLTKSLLPHEDYGGWDPHYIAEGLPTRIRTLFGTFSANERSRGCELMLLSAHPTENDGAAPWARCYVYRFYAPNFEPIEAAQTEIVSIGSGTDVKPYREALDNLSKNADVYKLEELFPGGSGFALMSSLTSLLLRSPTTGISKHLHICLVGRTKVSLGTNNPYISDTQGTDKAMPKVARSMDEVRKLLHDTSSSVLELAVC